MLRQRDRAVVQTLCPQHRAIVRTPFRHIKNVVQAKSQIAFNSGARRGVINAAVTRVHIRAHVRRHHKKICDRRNAVAIFDAPGLKFIRVLFAQINYGNEQITRLLRIFFIFGFEVQVTQQIRQVHRIARREVAEQLKIFRIFFPVFDDLGIRFDALVGGAFD